MSDFLSHVTGRCHRWVEGGGVNVPTLSRLIILLFGSLNWRRVLAQRERAEEGRAISSRR